ncbi:MAG TPA: uroporphyrinogen decarboxylase [Candidatus Limnocylindrales bacterium]|nr:uroporphyrinogen decarboxylase [Candidatus Limnocylindrales bacterium]
MSSRERFLAACHRRPVDATPVWFMRQAGSSLPAVRAMRQHHDPQAIALTPELAAAAAAAPVEALGVDAAVLFADVMLPLGPMGVALALTDSGPRIERPLRSAADVARLRPIEPEEDLGPVLAGARLLRDQLGDDTAVIGLAAGPFTLAAYLIEGGPSRDFPLARAFLHAQPAAWARLMGLLSDVVRSYLLAQAAAGVDAVQLFDSWAGALAPADYVAHVAPYTRRVLAGLPLPTVHFVAGAPNLLEAMATAGGDVIGLDWRVGLGEAWERLGSGIALQGNLDPARVLAGWGPAAQGARAILAEVAGRLGHVFNLGHAVAPGSDPGVLRDLVTLVHEASRAARPGREAA